jgi:uncharacterized membrane protein YedE/YeeE
VIDWSHFTPWPSLAGGLLIGAATALLLLVNGRIAGISGILGSVLRPQSRETGWRLAFLARLLAAPLVYGLATPLPQVSVGAGTGMLVLGGLLVGIGTRYGSGCTSGHGVCGISRLSMRSAAATTAFMLSGAAMVFVMQHLMG